MDQIDQEDQPVIAEKQVVVAGRLSNGQFAPGFNSNPNGAPPVAKGWQRYGDRVKYLQERYTPDEILNFAESRYARSKLSTIDAIAVMHIARALDPDLTKTKAGTDDVRGERKELLDRIEGQTKAQTEITGANGSAILPLIKIVFEANNKIQEEKEDEPLTIEQEPSSESNTSDINIPLPNVKLQMDE